MMQAAYDMAQAMKQADRIKVSRVPQPQQPSLP